MFWTSAYINRLIKGADHVKGTEATYSYNGLGQRSAKTEKNLTGEKWEGRKETAPAWGYHSYVYDEFGNDLVAETLNPYAYCFNNPLKWNDKNGFYPNYMTTEENISDANVDVTGNSVCNISNRTANILINEKSLLKSSANSLNLGIDEFRENMLSGVELANIISEVKTESNSEEIFTKEAGNSNQKRSNFHCCFRNYRCRSFCR